MAQNNYDKAIENMNKNKKIDMDSILNTSGKLNIDDVIEDMDKGAKANIEEYDKRHLEYNRELAERFVQIAKWLRELRDIKAQREKRGTSQK